MIDLAADALWKATRARRAADHVLETVTEMVQRLDAGIAVGVVHNYVPQRADDLSALLAEPPPLVTS